MTATHPLISKATSPLREAPHWGSLRERARVRAKAAAVSTEKAVEMMKLTKRQIEVTMFSSGVGKLEGWKVS